MSSFGNAEEIHALSGAYAVDALDPEERAQFEAHLAACGSCRAEVADLREATTVLGGLEDTAPPAALRDRVLDDIGTVRPLPPERPEASVARADVVRPRYGRRLLAAAAAVVAVAGGGAVLWQQTAGPDGSRVSVVDRVLQAADAERVTVELTDGASASVVRSVSEGRAVLLTRDMPAPPDGKVYELWLQTPAGVMVPAGLMEQPGSRPVPLDGDATHATAVGITIEPEGGSESPTTDPIAVFELA